MGIAAPTPDWSAFKKSTFSSDSGCVEVSFSTAGEVRLRDSKSRGNGPELHFDLREWRAFLSGVHDGQFEPFPRPAGD